MATSIIRFLNILMAGLVAGIVLGIWLGFDPRSFSYSTYLEHQQGAIAGLNVLMPILGLITIILTFASAFLQKNNRVVFVELIIAAVLLIVGGLITKFGNQPINKIVMTWTNTDIPSDWSNLRGKWWSMHQIRASCLLLAFFLIVWTNIRRSESNRF